MSGILNPSALSYLVDAAKFNGTTARMARGASLSGVSNGKTGIVSVWVKSDGAGGTTVQRIQGGATNLTRQSYNTGFPAPGGWNCTYSSAGADNNRQILSTSTFAPPTIWKHLLLVWDNATGGDGFRIYTNDVADGTLGVSNATLDYATGDWGVGADVSATNYFNGQMAELYFAPNQWLDMTVVANRRKFISALGKPVPIGVDGSGPTGTAPAVYLHLGRGEPPANFSINRGTGGNFTITGTLTTASSSPSD